MFEIRLQVSKKKLRALFRPPVTPVLLLLTADKDYLVQPEVQSLSDSIAPMKVTSSKKLSIDDALQPPSTVPIIPERDTDWLTLFVPSARNISFVYGPSSTLISSESTRYCNVEFPSESEPEVSGVSTFTQFALPVTIVLYIFA